MFHKFCVGWTNESTISDNIRFRIGCRRSCHLRHGQQKWWWWRLNTSYDNQIQRWRGIVNLFVNQKVSKLGRFQEVEYWKAESRTKIENNLDSIITMSCTFADVLTVMVSLEVMTLPLHRDFRESSGLEHVQYSSGVPKVGRVWRPDHHAVYRRDSIIGFKLLEGGQQTSRQKLTYK